MKFLIIILFFIPTLLFGQLTKENDSTFVLKMNKQQMDKFFEKMVKYDINDSLLQLEKSDNEDLKKLVAVKDSIIKKDSLIIVKKDEELNNAQKWIDNEMSTKLDFWQGAYIGLNTESSQETQWNNLDKDSFKYSFIAEVNFKVGKFMFRPGVNLYLNDYKPKYFLNLMYRVF